MNVFIKRFDGTSRLPPGLPGSRRQRKEEWATAKKKPEAQPKEGRKRKLRLRILIPLLILALLAGLCAWYLTTYYPADEAAIAAFSADYSVEEYRLENGDLTFGTGREEWGLIFYPGGKVAQEAYVPLMRELASEGVFCVLCEMPCHLAIFDPDAADGIREAYPEVRHWYLGGHSLGGVMAADYAAEHSTDFDGLILLAAYSRKDLSGSGLRVLSAYGSEDGVLNRKAYARNRSNLPGDARELVIEGGCHAGFGMYGPQRRDGTPTITAAQQIHRTAAAILALLRGEEA